MTKLQRLQLRASEIRNRLNELGGAEDLTDEQRSEIETLRNEYSENETRQQALMVAGDEPQLETRGGEGIDVLETRESPEDRELAALIGRASLGRIVDNARENRSADGAEKELQDHYGMSGDQVPLVLLETRAAATASIPATTQGNQQPIIPVVFPNSATAFLGIEQPTVPTGQAIYPIMTAPVDGPDSVDKAENVADEAASFGAEALGPRRLQRSFTYNREDAATFAGLDEALRMNLNESLSDGLDNEVLNRAAVGLFNELAAPAEPAAAAAGDATYFGEALEAIYNSVDGRYASSVADVRLLLGPATYRAWGALYRTANSNESALEAVMRLAGGVQASAHVPAAANSLQEAIAARALGMRHAVAPIWDGVQIISDPYSLSQDGQIRLTAVMLYNFKAVRKAGFSRRKFRLGG